MNEDDISLEEFISCCSDLLEKIAKCNRSRRVNFAYLFLSRQVMTAYSINIIFEKNVADFPSGYVLLRVLYENYLQTYHAMLSSRYRNCRELIIDVISYHANKELYNLSIEMNNKNNIKLYNERILREKESIKANEKYYNLPNSIKNYIDISFEKKTRIFKCKDKRKRQRMYCNAPH